MSVARRSGKQPEVARVVFDLRGEGASCRLFPYSGQRACPEQGQQSRAVASGVCCEYIGMIGK